MTNELLFLVTALAIFAFVRFCFIQGRRWLQASIVINLILITVFGAKLVTIFGAVTNVGNVFYAMVFFATQLIVEHYGKREARRSILLGASSIVFFIAIGQLTVSYEGIAASSAANDAMAALFKFTPRLALASITAYVFAQSVNIWVYAYMRRTYRPQIWIRSASASASGQLIDSVIFFTIAFAGVLPTPILIQSMLTGFAVKFLIGVGSIPFLYSSYLARFKKEILEQEAEAILLSVGEGLVMTDKDGKIMMVNKAFEQMLGWKIDEVMGKQMTDVLVREDETGNKIALQNRILTGILAGKTFSTSSVNHSYFKRRDNSRFPVKIVATPVIIDGQIMGAVETFYDVTEEKMLDQMRADFLSLASHQLRTPLSGTRWLVETLQGQVLGKLNKKQRAYVDDLAKINGRMILLVSELLNVLHIQSGQITLKKQMLPVSVIFDEVMVMMQPAAKQTGVILEPQKPPAVAVHTDLHLVKTILESFTSNAINYSKSGQKVLLNATDEGKDVVFSVKDMGIGIPKHEQEKIFEKFYRASNAKLALPGGTGLGLYTASILASKLGATITFDSAENEGTTFYLHVPKDLVNEAVKEAGPEAIAASAR